MARKVGVRRKSRPLPASAVRTPPRAPGWTERCGCGHIAGRHDVHPRLNINLMGRCHVCSCPEFTRED